MKYFGIDYGSKKVGLAISDEEGKLAFPFLVLSNDRQLAQKIAQISQREKAETIIIGQSLDFAGRPNPIMKKIEKFKKELEGKIGQPLIYEPEILTTQAAKRIQGASSKTDASAAALILQSYLDRKNARPL